MELQKTGDGRTRSREKSSYRSLKGEQRMGEKPGKSAITKEEKRSFQKNEVMRLQVG